jgi:DNA-3-methyladenine glycosylase
MKILDCSFYQRNTLVVAHELIGKLLIRMVGSQMLMGRIVETEAYSAQDPACHAYGGKTERNKALFGPVGHAYVYQSYGIHFCFNAVARDEQTLAGGVLIRALEPLEGLKLMYHHRRVTNIALLTSGPGRLAQALAITAELYSHDLTGVGVLSLADDGFVPSGVRTTSRIGISKGQALPWRFILEHSFFLSKKC